MDRQQFITMANKFQSVLDEDVLNERGQQVGFAKRERLITPFRLGLSVVASIATQQVQTLADLHRQFNELWELESDYKAFYKPTVSLGVTYAVVYTYGCGNGRIWPTHCAVIDAGLDGRC